MTADGISMTVAIALAVFLIGFTLGMLKLTFFDRQRLFSSREMWLYTAFYGALAVVGAFTTYWWQAAVFGFCTLAWAACAMRIRQATR